MKIWVLTLILVATQTTVERGDDIMITRQIQFRDDENVIHGGILVKENDNNGFIICDCCGCIFDLEDVTIITTYDYWVDLDSEIIGE